MEGVWINTKRNYEEEAASEVGVAMVVEEVVAGEEVEVVGALEGEVMGVAEVMEVVEGVGTMVAAEDLVAATGDGVVGRAAAAAAVAVAVGSTAGRRSGATRAGAGGGAPGARETAVLVPLSPFLMNWKFLINIKPFNYLHPSQ